MNADYTIAYRSNNQNNQNFFNCDYEEAKKEFGDTYNFPKMLKDAKLSVEEVITFVDDCDQIPAYLSSLSVEEEVLLNLQSLQITITEEELLNAKLEKSDTGAYIIVPETILDNEDEND
jgi:hypothetical protein